MLTLASLSAMRVGVLRAAEPSCASVLLAVLRHSPEPMTFTQLRDAVGNRWPKYRMSSALSKLIEWGNVKTMPPARPGRIKGRLYVATPKPYRRLRQGALQSRLAGAYAESLWEAAHSRTRAGYWDGLVPAPEAVNA